MGGWVTGKKGWGVGEGGDKGCECTRFLVLLPQTPQSGFACRRHVLKTRVVHG